MSYEVMEWLHSVVLETHVGHTTERVAALGNTAECKYDMDIGIRS